jgi:single-stranded DNA-specific DHH superfamily exonuclease
MPVWDRCRHPGCDRVFKNQTGVKRHMKKCKKKPRQIEYVSRESIYRSIGKEMPGLLKPGSNISAIVETVNKIADIVEEDAEMMECNFNDDEETAEITGTGNTSYETKMPCGEGIHVPPIAERDAELLQIQLRHGFSNAATAAIARYMHIFRCLLKNRILI